MPKITNAVLAERIHAVHVDVKEMKCEVRSNTAFRHKANGIIAMIALGATFVGGIAMKLIDKLWK